MPGRLEVWGAHRKDAGYEEGRELRQEGESEQCGPFPDERALECSGCWEQAGLDGTKTGSRMTGYGTTSGRRHSGTFKIHSLLVAHSSHVENLELVGQESVVRLFSDRVGCVCVGRSDGESTALWAKSNQRNTEEVK